MKLFSFIVVAFFVCKGADAQIDFDKKLKELGIELYAPTKPMGNYVKVVRTLRINPKSSMASPT